jgi:hypothetical protein
MNGENLYSTFLKLIESGDEQAGKDFLIEHLDEFPDEVRKSIILAFFEDALIRQDRTSQAFVDFEKQGLEAVNTAEKIRSALEKQGRLIEIKESL